jgi:hypothetical protein
VAVWDRFIEPQSGSKRTQFILVGVACPFYKFTL